MKKMKRMDELRGKRGRTAENGESSSKYDNSEQSNNRILEQHKIIDKNPNQHSSVIREVLPCSATVRQLQQVAPQFFLIDEDAINYSVAIVSRRARIFATYPGASMQHSIGGTSSPPTKQFIMDASDLRPHTSSSTFATKIQQTAAYVRNHNPFFAPSPPMDPHPEAPIVPSITGINIPHGTLIGMSSCSGEEAPHAETIVGPDSTVVEKKSSPEEPKKIRYVTSDMLAAEESGAGSGTNIPPKNGGSMFGSTGRISLTLDSGHQESRVNAGTMLSWEWRSVDAT